MNIFDELHWRGMIADCTHSEGETATPGTGVIPPYAPGIYAKPDITVYCGFDPTGDSLHVGSLFPLLALRRFQLAGHHPIALAGGATGMIGDPSGKSAERNLQTPEQVAHNISCIKGQLARFLDFDATTNPARLVNNADWTSGISYLEFLRDFGKYFTVNWMIAKESVRARMEDRDIGISYTEFSYMLLQALDFYHLRKEFGCELQVGGTDQWGNITAGVELIRKKLGLHADGLVFPLLTKADGSKYGKTAEGAVWLDRARTSEFKFYQFFVNTEDAEVVRLLKVLTFRTQAEIESLEAKMRANPAAREAQKALGRDVTTLVHGAAAADAVVAASEKFFSAGGLIPPEVFPYVINEVPGREIDGAYLPSEGKPLVELLVDSGLCQSKGQARRDVEGGGIYVNGERASDFQFRIQIANFLHGRFLVLKKGKGSNVFLFRLRAN
jgi:tyrosyl-tRNA synthetase